MKDRIKKFWDSHETFQSVVATVTGATIALGAVAIIVNGTKVTETEFDRQRSGRTYAEAQEWIQTYHLRKNNQIAEV